MNVEIGAEADSPSKCCLLTVMDGPEKGFVFSRMDVTKVELVGSQMTEIFTDECETLDISLFDMPFRTSSKTSVGSRRSGMAAQLGCPG